VKTVAPSAKRKTCSAPAVERAFDLLDSFTMKLSGLGASMVASLDLRQQVAPLLRSLAAETNITAHLAVLATDEAIYIDRAEAAGELRLTLSSPVALKAVQVRANAHDVSMENESGVCGIGARVFDHRGQVAAPVNLRPGYIGRRP